MLQTFDKSSQVFQALTNSPETVSPETRITAQTWLKMLDEIIAVNQLDWLDPLINVSPNAEIVLEWWHHTKKLTVYIEADRAEYVQVWGTDIDDEMANGDASQASNVETLWLWLL